MQLLNHSKRIINSTVVGGTAFALMLVPTTAFAHGSGSPGNANDNNSSHKAASSRTVHKNDPSSQDKSRRDRQKLTCTQLQQVLNQRAADAKTRDQKRLTGLNIVLNGAQTYVASGGVSVANYDSLNASATNDQTAATTAINAIAAPQLNCDDQTAAAAASDDKTAKDHDNTSVNGSINTAQQSLNTYRKDLNNLFEAVINS